MTFVDQAVFGYRDGHEILGSSIDVSASLESELLPHVDASFDDDSQHYVVGKKLSTEDKYLLARIWPAEEAPRPGAIWTHAFLIDPDDLRDIAEAAMRKFRRPSFENLADYSLPVEISQGEIEECQAAVVHDDQNFVAAVAFALFDEPSFTSVLVWPDAWKHESAFTQILGALPSRAASSVSFRSRGRAKLGASTYQLQVASKLLGGTPGQFERVFDLRNEVFGKHLGWVDSMADSSEKFGIRDYFRLFDANSAVDDAGSVRRLIDLWTKLKEVVEPQSVVDAITSDEILPGGTHELDLPLFGPSSEHCSLWKVGERTRLVCIANNVAHFDLDEVQFVDRIVQLAESSPVSAVRALTMAQPALRKSEATRAIHKLSANPSSRLLAQAQKSGILSAFASANPDLCFDAPSAAGLDANGRLVLLHAAIEAHGGEEVAAAMLRREMYSDLRLSLDSGAINTRCLLDGAIDKPRDIEAFIIDDSGWFLGHLSKDGFDSEAADLTLATISVDQLNAVAPEDLCELARRVRGGTELRDEHAFSTACVLLGFAFGNDDAQYDPIIISLFAPISRRLSSRTMSDKRWRAVSWSFQIGSDMSRPAQLQSALLARAHTNRWNSALITEALTDSGVKAKSLRKNLRSLGSGPVGATFDLLLHVARRLTG